MKMIKIRPLVPIRYYTANQNLSTQQQKTEPIPIKSHNNTLAASSGKQNSIRPALYLDFLKILESSGNYTEILRKKVITFVENVSHFTEVTAAREAVVDIMHQLREAREQKRTFSKNLDEVRSKLNVLYKKMNIEIRTNNNYIELLDEEVLLCKQEKHLVHNIALANEKEETLYNNLLVAIVVSNDTERLYSKKVKVWSVAAAVLSSLLALFGSPLLYKMFRISPNGVEAKVEELDKRIKPLEVFQHKQTESWGSYLKRNTKWIYSWAYRSN